MNLLYLFERQSLWMRRQLYVGVSSDSWSGSGGHQGDGLQVDARWRTCSQWLMPMTCAAFSSPLRCSVATHNSFFGAIFDSWGTLTNLKKL